MTPYLILTAYLILLTITAASARASDPPKGGVVARTIVATWRCQDKLPQQRTFARSPWKHHSRGYWQAELNRWQLRLNHCRAVLKRRAYEWNPQLWLPGNWARVANCETSTNWYFTGHSTDGHFVSAFAISVQEYDRDARLMGVRGWWDKKTPPSPWEQLQAAKGHLKRFGDGWTGRCHGLVYT